MRRFIVSVAAALALAATAGGAAQASGPKVVSHGGHQSHHLTYGTTFSGNSFYSVGQLRWSFRVWDAKFARYHYWDPHFGCYYYWYAPHNCYYPITYVVR
jgi:hypothetical protein